MIALLIDIVALLCLARFSGLAYAVNQGEPVVDPAGPIVLNEQISPVDQIKSRVLRGDLGAQPSQRQLLDEVKTAFRELADNGQLIKNGQCFELCIDARGEAA